MTTSAATSERDILGAPFGLGGDVIARELGVEVASGLSNDEAARRLGKYGPNELEAEDPVPWWLIFLRQFSSIVVWLLLVAMVISYLTEGIPEAAAIFIVLLINAVVGFAVEWRAGRALEALKDQTVSHARARREGIDAIIDSSQLVIGDIIDLAAGDRVPADARLLEAANLRSDESALTGESFPVDKSIESVAFSSILSERRSMLYMGTMVVAGRGLAIVTGTGDRTELGRVGQLITKTTSERTPLERKLESLGKTLVYLVLAIGVIVFFSGLLRGNSPSLMLEVAISLAVAAVPEGLPAMMTLILALGVLRMAKKQAIVRRLSAVETLGSTTVICSDKTGTLTENRMTVREYRLSNGEIVTGHAEPDGLAARLVRAGVLCSDAAESPDGKSDAIGDPTETALIVAAREFGLDIFAERSKFELIAEEPFDARTRRMIVTLRAKNSGDRLAVAKGAPSVVLAMCSRFVAADGSVQPLDDKLREAFLRSNDEMAEAGLRVLAFADKALADGDDVENGHTFLGFAGMSDRMRDGVIEAIDSARLAGVRTVMLTGDQIITARTVARDLGLGENGNIVAMHASEFAYIGEQGLASVARRADVFARVSPEDKLRIVEALQNSGDIVAVTGDGINDAPALKRSDIGIAMGLRGTEVAKEAADIVLADDNFSTIVAAIEEGRTIYANIVKFVHLLFSHNLGEVLVIFAAIVIGFPLPLLPLQILWINIVTDIFPALALAVDPPSPGIMLKPPRLPGDNILSRGFLFTIGWQGAMLAALVLGSYLWALDTYGEGPHARTVAMFAVVGVELGHTFNCRSRIDSAFTRFFANKYIFVAAGLMIALQMAAVYVPLLSRLLDLTTPNAFDVLVTLGCIFAPVIVVEIVKAVTLSRERRPTTP